MLKTMAPAISHVGLMFNPETFPYYDANLQAFQQQSRGLVEVTRAAVHSRADIETEIAAIATRPGGGLIVATDPFTSSNWPAIRAALERHRLPHTVTFRQFVSEGALMSYGPNSSDTCRRSASYVDRILKGANPAELPAQAPDKYELAINRTTAKSLGLEIPSSLLATADEVIE